MATEQDALKAISSELAAREPIFHRPEFGTTRNDFDRMMAEDFWEVGASGKRYSRAFVLESIEQRHREPVAENFNVSEFRCQHIALNHYLVTYLFDQAGRISRRSTLWHKSAEGWKIVYHQGTLVQDSNGDT